MSLFRTVIVSGRANNGGNAGLTYVNSNNAPTNSNANHGSQIN